MKNDLAAAGCIPDAGLDGNDRAVSSSHGGVHALCKILFVDVSLRGFSNGGILARTVGSAAAYRVMGMVVFRWREHTAMRWGA